MMRCLLGLSAIILLTVLTLPTAPAQAADQAAGLFAPDKLIAWCIVPFDAKKRGPAERVAMLKRLGLKHYAYDWRAEHLPTFDTEIALLKKNGIQLDAVWFPGGLNPDARTILGLLEKHQVRTQLWVSMGDPAPQAKEQAAKAKAGAAAVRPIAEAAAKIGCRVALYNHGGWFGEPENQVAIVEQLQMPNVGIVYNLHHGHGHIARFPELLRKMQPHLLAINLNGMVIDGDKAGKKILTLGEGDQELAMMKTLRVSGWRGPVGILDHRPETDSEETLRANLAGLQKLRKQLTDEGTK